MRRAFTLVELMLVVAIMGLLGTLSIGGYRAMRRGMEERGTMQNVNQFIRNAYQRAMIDRQPTAIYFWNETRREESDSESIIVVGRAVAVRRAGRISAKSGQYLVDEFGDLASYKGIDDEGDEDEGEEAEDGIKTYLYKINGNEKSFQRSIIGQATRAVNQNIPQMMTDIDWKQNNTDAEIPAYGYYLRGGNITWEVGDAYGFEFADITLPNNYIFESQYSKTIRDNPIKTLDKVLRFSPESSPGGQTITVSALRMGKGGSLAVQKVEATKSADSQLSEQNK